MKVQHQITISAPINLVWKTSIDIPNLPNWTPTIEEAKLLSENFNIGSTVLLKQPDMPHAVWTVTSLDEGKSFSWETKVSGLKMRATHILEETSSGLTKNILELKVSGFIAMILWPMIKSKITKALQDENQGLKRYCEQVH
jgi:uncharacterized membrane protein